MRQPLSAADTAWLRMDHPTNLMVICGVMTLDGPLGRDELERSVAERMLAFDRFRQRIVDRDGSPAWEEDPLFDLHAHVHRTALPAPGGQAELEELVADLMATPLDPTKPLWQIHLVERFGEGSAVITRIHHSIADGIALVRALLAMTASRRDAGAAFHRTDAPRAIENPLWEIVRPAAELAAETAAAAEILFHEGIEILRRPTHALELARGGLDVAQTLARLAFLRSDSDTIFRGPLGVAKRVAWAGGIRLEDVKTIGHALGATVNDVLLAALAGSFRRYLQRRSKPVDDVEIRILMPVDLRPIDESPMTLGNRFGLAYVELPLGIADPRARVREISRRTRAIKDSHDAPVAFGILQAIGLASAEMERQAIDLFSRKATAVVTNVPGPKTKLWYAGRRLERMMFWVPQSGRVGLGVSILSYDHEISVGVTADAGLVPDPHPLVFGVHEELQALASAAAQPAAGGAR